MIMLALTALAACQPKTEKVPAIDMTDLDLTVAPGDDFYRYANGGWMQKNPLKPEYARFGSGRTVRGGGGIRPDILIDVDTTEYSQYQAQLIRRGVVNEYVGVLMDSRRDSLQRLYPTFERFDEAFEIDDATLCGLTELGAERGVAPDEAGFAVSAELLRVQLKALVAQRLFGTEGYYRVVNRLRSEAFREAVSLLEAWEQQGRPLLENRK